jgi:hypothetical protein
MGTFDLNEILGNKSNTIGVIIVTPQETPTPTQEEGAATPPQGTKSPAEDPYQPMAFYSRGGEIA